MNVRKPNNKIRFLLSGYFIFIFIFNQSKSYKLLLKITCASLFCLSPARNLKTKKFNFKSHFRAYPLSDLGHVTAIIYNAGGVLQVTSCQQMNQPNRQKQKVFLRIVSLELTHFLQLSMSMSNQMEAKTETFFD